MIFVGIVLFRRAKEGERGRGVGGGVIRLFDIQASASNFKVEDLLGQRREILTFQETKLIVAKRCVMFAQFFGINGHCMPPVLCWMGVYTPAGRRSMRDRADCFLVHIIIGLGENLF